MGGQPSLRASREDLDSKRERQVFEDSAACEKLTASRTELSNIAGESFRLRGGAVAQIVNDIYILRMIRRNLERRLHEIADRMPAVAVTGPRQSGKTTLCRMAFPERAYVSLEPLDVREFARTDPRGFLAQHRGGAILDEVQRAPDLFSYLQEEVDRDPEPGRFILTGSQHFGLSEAITQSLAGRVGRLHLLPLSLDELRRFDAAPADLWTTLWGGAYPRIYDRHLDPARWLADYVATYVQRDVRQVLNVTDLDAFTTFLRLVAGRTGQERHLSALGSDAGVSHNTARSWLSVLETSFVVFRVPRWHRSLRKRAVKAPKIHLVDSGLACHLLGIREPGQLRTHPQRGALFESWVAAEILKARVHDGRDAELFHLREDRGVEVDLVVESGRSVLGVEVKSGATVVPEFLTSLRELGRRIGREHPHVEYEARLLYGGEGAQDRSDGKVVPWHSIHSIEW
ncbi:MAG: ATP-binding protein [Gemmatimonadota bacterium]